MFHARSSIFASLLVAAAFLFAGAHAPSRAAERPPVPSSTAAAATKSAVAEATKPASAEVAKPAAPKVRNPRVLVITQKNDLRCDAEMRKLNNSTFVSLRAAGWTVGNGPENMVQIIDREQVPEIAAQIEANQYPTVACIDKDEIVRHFRYGCTTPLDTWTFGFLAKGVDERPAGTVKEAARVEWTGNYPLRGNHWSFEGDFNPSKETCVGHLRGPVNAKYLLADWKIEDWSIEELRSLHDDLHEKYPDGSAGPSSSGNSNSQQLQSNPGTAYRKFKG